MAYGASAIELPYASKPASWMNPTTAPTGNPYSAAVSQQAGDYDKIMGNYESLFKTGRENRAQSQSQFSPLSARTVDFQGASPYAPTQDFTNLKSKLTENSETGGYSGEEISNLRARGISPIRAIYAAALRNLSRQKNVTGGYSPNYGALQAKLAREQSSQIGEQTIRANADIADRQASGRQAAISQLSPLVGRENELSNSVTQSNAQGQQRVAELNAAEGSNVDKINAQMAMEAERLNREGATNAFQQQLGATQGMQSLYGTTPALTQTFGNQMLASNAQNLQGQQAVSGAAQNRANTGLNMISKLYPNGFRLG